MTRSRVIPLLIGASVLAVGLLMVLSSKGFGQNQDESPGAEGSGEHAFQLYCSNCHGDGGHGDFARRVGGSENLLGGGGLSGGRKLREPEAGRKDSRCR